MSESENKPEEQTKNPGFFAVVWSVLASILGVQSQKNMERDMKAKSPLPYIFIGLLGTVLFIFTVIAVVRLVLKSAGA